MLKFRRSCRFSCFQWQRIMCERGDRSSGIPNSTVGKLLNPQCGHCFCGREGVIPLWVTPCCPQKWWPHGGSQKRAGKWYRLSGQLEGSSRVRVSSAAVSEGGRCLVGSADGGVGIHRGSRDTSEQTCVMHTGVDDSKGCTIRRNRMVEAGV